MLALGAVSFSILSACGSSSDEEQVRAVIAAAEAAAESRDASDAMKLVADDYADERGYDKQQLHQYLRGYLLMHPKIELLVNVDDIEFETASRARVQVEIAMLGTQRGAGDMQAKLAGELESWRVDMQRRDGEWRVTRVDRVAR